MPVDQALEKTKAGGVKARAPLSYIPSLLLIVIAIYQIHLARTVELNPWKGGGFGMFSSTQHGFVRYVRIFVSAPDRSEELNIPESLQSLADRAATLPTNGQLQKLARAVADEEIKAKRSVSQVRIEVWRSQYQKDTLAAVTLKFKDYVFTLD